MTVGQFLDKLPKSVIRGGKVIDIRSSVGENLSGVGFEGKWSENYKLMVISSKKENNLMLKICIVSDCELFLK